MITRLFRLGIALATLAGLAACEQTGSTLLETIATPGGTTLATAADVRTVNQIRRADGRGYVTCAEPSPDVAKAVGQSFNFGGSLSVQGLPANISPQVAASIARARAESIAQLGERLATIQLLRDGLYRACEAYANGAISPTAYAVILSRFDDTMITMLSTEVAGGAFGRSLATAGSTAEGNASASADVEQKIKEAIELQEQLAKATQENTSAGAGETNRTSKTVEDKQRELKQKLDSAAKSAATASATAAGAIEAGKQNPEIAKTIATMQRKYIENLNYDALEVACVSALDKTEADTTVLGRFCQTALLPTLQRQKTELLKAVLERAWKERDEASSQVGFTNVIDALDQNVKRIDALVKMIDKLKQK